MTHFLQAYQHQFASFSPAMKAICAQAVLIDLYDNIDNKWLAFGVSIVSR